MDSGENRRDGPHIGGETGSSIMIKSPCGNKTVYQSPVKYILSDVLVNDTNSVRTDYALSVDRNMKQE